MRYEFHPLANIFPLMKSPELRRLADDIAQNGQQEKVVLCDGMILDGRNRAMAFALLAEEDEDEDGLFETIDLTEYFRHVDPLPYVLSQNLHRRHLTASQRASVAAEVKKIEAQRAKERQGTRADLQDNIPVNLPECSKTGDARDIAAKQLNVSGRLVDMAETVADHGTPELQEAVRDGEVSVSAAATIAKEPPEVQRRAVAGGKKGVAAEAKRVRQAKSTSSFNLSAAQADLKKQIIGIAGTWPTEAYPALVATLRQMADQIESQCTSNNS